MASETRERLVVRILLTVAQIVGRSLPESARHELDCLCTHMRVTKWEEEAPDA